MTARFTLVTDVAVAPDVLFDLSLDIDVHLASMSESGERAVGGITTGRIGLGETITWKARHFGVPFTMTSRVTALEHPHRFVDEQVAGPFRRFAHEHVFLPTGIGTRMVDTLVFAAPLIGMPVERPVLLPYLRRLIRTRNRTLVQAALR